MNMTINYKNGNMKRANIDYIHIEGNKVYFHEQKNPQNVIEPPSHALLECVDTIDVFPETLGKDDIGFYRADGSKL